MKQTMWKKALALALSAATMFSTAVPTFAGTEAPASSSSEEESVESTDGTFLVQLKSRGGSVLLQDDTGKQTISLDDDGNLMVSGAEGTAYADLDSEGYATLSYGIGTSVTVTAKSDDGYSVADYTLTTADGTEDKDLTGSSEYSESVTITEDPVKLSVSFVKDKAETKEETKKETKEEPAETEQTSGKIYTDTEGNTYTDPMLYYYGQSAIYAGQTGTSAASPRRMARRAAVTVLEQPTEDISTMAVDRQTGTHTAALGETVFVDTVSYTGLVVGKEYTLNATLMNKDTKEPVKVDGKEILFLLFF